MTFPIQEVNGQNHYAAQNHHNSGTEGKFVAIFHFWSNTGAAKNLS